MTCRVFSCRRRIQADSVGRGRDKRNCWSPVSRSADCQIKSVEEEIVEDFAEKVWSYVVREEMLVPGDHLLLAVSGGADSVALLRLALVWRQKYDLRLRVLHVEHGLRGQESLEDAAWVQSLCGKYSLPCQVVPVEVRVLAQAERRSEEEAARELRYRVLEEAAARWEDAKIVLAHNSNDAAETLLFHLARGTGLEGLSAIPPRRGKIVRPLLTVSRVEIEDWLRSLGQEWRMDRTNEEDTYSRNRIRHQVLPPLLQENERALEHMMRTTEIVREASDYIRGQAERVLSQYLLTGRQQESGLMEQVLPIPAKLALSLDMRREDPFLQREMLRLVLQTAAGRARDLGYAHVQALLDLMRGQAGKQLDLPYGLLVVRGYESLQFFRGAPDGEETDVCPKEANGREGQTDRIPSDLEVGDEGEIALGRDRYHYRLLEGRGEVPSRPMPYTKAFDYDKIRTALQIRLREPHDLICIDAVGHRQSLKRFMINRKIPAGLRASCPLLADGSEIVWLVGYRQSQAYQADRDTRRILEIRRVKDE